MDDDRSMDDGELLRLHACGDAAAFTALVRRHVDMVYGAARRMLGGPGAEAEDVVQAVFLLLSQRAGKLQRQRWVAGWLYRATGYCCRNVRKGEGRRRRREREAAAMRDEVVQETQSEWAGMLDEGLARLAEHERAAVLVKYLEGKTAGQAGKALGISEDAAEKRAERGLAKLRRFFAGRGFAVPAAGVALWLAEEGARAAPAALAAKVSGGLGVGASAAVIAKGAGQMMWWAKMKVAAAVCVGTGAAAACGVLLFAQATRGQENAVVIGAPVPAGRRAMMVRWDVVMNEAGAARVAAALTAVKADATGYSAYVGDAAKARAAVAAGDVLLPPTRAGWASINEEGTLSRSSDFGLESSGVGGGMQVDPGNPLRVVVTTRSTGPVKAAAVKGAVRLDLSGESHEVAALATDGMPQVVKPTKFGFTGEVKAGEAAVFIGEVVTKAGVKLVHVSVWEVFLASDAEYAYLRRTQANAVMERGVNDVLAAADQAIAWNAGGKRNPDAVGPAWEKRLESGAIVRLVGVSRPGAWADCWWDAEGRAVAWDPHWGSAPGSGSAADVAVGVSVEDPSVKDPQGLRGYGSAGRRLATLRAPDDGVVEVGISAGPWTDGGAAEIGTAVEVAGVKLRVERPEVALRRSGSSPGLTWVKWEEGASPDVEVRVAAVDKGGRELDEAAPPEIFSGHGERRGAEMRPQERAIRADAAEIAAYRVKWRKREWVTFEKFATMPVESPGGPAASQKSVELVNGGTPEAFMAGLRAAAVSGDAQKVRALMKADGALAVKYADLMAEEFASSGALWSAAVKKFGAEETATALRYVARLPEAKLPEGLAWEVTADRARMVASGEANVVMTSGPMDGLVREHGQWRIEVAIPKLTAEQEQEFAAQLPRMVKLAERRRALASEVVAGKYKDAYAVRDALQPG
jgi:RNA polymerase sigma factor (sigma-70 family)